jgi:hypothetical protein
VKHPITRLAAAATLIPGLLGLAACSSGHAGGAAVTRPHARLEVHIDLFGGPVRPDGRSALSNSPVPRVRIIAIDASGARRSALTGSDGTAGFDLPIGRYTVVPHYCGETRHHVAVAAGHTARVQIACPVP